MKKILQFTLLLIPLRIFASDILPNDIEALERLATQGNSQALVQLGYMYFTGNGVKRNVIKAREYYEKAAEFGEHWALNNLCNMYLYGEGVDKNLIKAFQYCKEAAKLGNSSSMVMLGEIAANKNGPFKESYETAMEYSLKFYEMAAERQHPHGQFMVGMYHEQGIVVNKNLVLAREWYTKAADQNYDKALTALKRLVK